MRHRVDELPASNMNNSIARTLTLRSIGIVGTVIFSLFFALTFSTPTWVEEFASDYIEGEATERLDQGIDSIQVPESDSGLARLARSIYERNQEQIEVRREQLREKVHEKKADALAQIRNLDCECRKKAAERLKRGFEIDIGFLQASNERITDFVQYKYATVAHELKRDIRIFTASNAAAFLLLLLISFIKPAAMLHLFLPGVLLAISTLVCSYFYVFEQNWLLTVIHSEYLGFAYLGWLGFVFLLFCDIALNRARVTSFILNAFFSAIGSALSVIPC